ncbi:MAG: hypothetical protein DRJ57_04200 [Thermoprotei archaeon]|nr:MAG: hypothetical protein DRJ57_04200 [Thermoprotei archaeon]
MPSCEENPRRGGFEDQGKQDFGENMPREAVRYESCERKTSSKEEQPSLEHLKGEALEGRGEPESTRGGAWQHRLRKLGVGEDRVSERLVSASIALLVFTLILQVAGVKGLTSFQALAVLLLALGFMSYLLETYMRYELEERKLPKRGRSMIEYMPLALAVGAALTPS